MSFNENFDKVFLAAGSVIGVALLGLGYMTMSGQEERYAVNTDIASKKIELPEVKQAKSLNDRLTKEYEVTRPLVGKGQQPLDIFVAPELWLDVRTNSPVDLYASAPLHPPIPNKWFFDHKLEDLLKYADALDRDPDGDGYTILEEYESKTDPADPNSHPPLINKLVAKEIKVKGYFLIFSQDYGTDYGFKAITASQQTIGKPMNGLTPGAKFGVDIPNDDSEKTRFELEKVEKKSFTNTRTGIEEEDSVAYVKDLKPTKNGVVYEIRKGNKYPQPVRDISVVFAAEAGSAANQEVTVEEGAVFSIPGDTTNKFKLQSVDIQNKKATVVPENSTDAETKWELTIP